jgi:hypothetical protein
MFLMMQERFFLTLLFGFLLSTFSTLFVPVSLIATYVAHLHLAHLKGNGWQVHDAKLKVIWHSAEQIDVQLSVASLQLPSPLHQVKSLHVACAHASIHGAVIRCERGTLQVQTPLLEQKPMRLSFRYHHDSRAVHFTLNHVGLAGGSIDIAGRFDQPQWQLSFTANVIDVAQLSQLLLRFPQLTFLPLEEITGAGTLSVNAHLSGQGEQVQTLEVNGTLQDLTFADREARRAGEKLTTSFALKATEQHDQWQLHAEFVTQQGQLYIEPVFVHVSELPLSLTLAGSWQPTTGQVKLAQIRFHHPGILQADGQLQFATQDTVQLTDAQLQVAATPLSDLYTTYLQPFLIGTFLDTLDTSGQVGLVVDYHQDRASSATATLESVDLDDQKDRYGLHGLTGTLAWTNEKAPPVPSHLSWQDGYVYNLPIGAGRLAGEAHGERVHLLEQMTIPVLDGSVQIDNFLLTRLGSPQLQWEFDGRLTPMSMETFSQAMGWPLLSGQLSGTIPHVTYVDGRVTVDGSLHMQVFDGEVTVNNLRLEQPFSIVPHLSADIELNNLDLERLTGTFAFGKIQGKLSGHIHNLHLQDWQPVTFDAHFATPPDDRSKRTISQKAVDNLSSLGGIGGALSRSFLRVFDEFSYNRLGLSCRLRNKVCEMDGVEPAKKGYYIVKGGCLPRIDIIGHVRQVDWPELIDRLKRATHSTGPVLQ